MCRVLENQACEWTEEQYNTKGTFDQFQDKILYLVSVSNSLLGIERQKKLKKVAILTEDLGAVLNYWDIETWPICHVEIQVTKVDITNNIYRSISLSPMWLSSVFDFLPRITFLSPRQSQRNLKGVCSWARERLAEEPAKDKVISYLSYVYRHSYGCLVTRNASLMGMK